MRTAAFKRSALHAVTFWLDGLRLPLPPAIQDWLLPRKHAVAVALHGSGLSLPLATPDGTAKMLSCPDVETLITRFGEQYDPDQYYPVIELPAAQVLEKKLRLPRSGEGKLAGLVRFELERVLPLPLDAVLYNFTVDANDTDPAWVTVTVLVCPHAALGVLTNPATSTAPRPDIVARTPAGQQLDMGNSVGRALRSRYRMPCRPRSAWVLTAATALCLFAPPFYLQWQSRSLEAQVAAHEARLAMSQAAIINPGAGGFSDDADYVPPLNLLRELTTQLPAPVWLLSMSVSEGRLQLQGVGPSAAQALAIVESSAYFEKADFLSPVTPSDDATMEAFQILATVRVPHGN